MESNFTYAEAEVMARRYLRSLDETAEVCGADFEIALGRVMDAIDLIERCHGHVTFTPPLSPAGGVYGEETRRNWLTGVVR